MICCGFGHRDYFKNIEPELDAVIESLISEGTDTFYTGGMGDFDSKFSSAVRKAKRQHKEIRLILVKPYFSNELNTNKEYYSLSYDDVVIPFEIAGTHYKAAIQKRNRWMVEQSAIVISGVYREYGGAYETIKYAKKTGKRIIELIKK